MSAVKESRQPTQLRMTPDSVFSVLERAEQQGISIEYSCRQGFCGMCRCQLISGAIDYVELPLACVNEGEFLPCCSIASTDITFELPLSSAQKERA